MKTGLFILVVHTMLNGIDVSLVLGDRAYVQQDDCEKVRQVFLQADMQGGDPKLDLECKPLRVIE